MAAGVWQQLQGSDNQCLVATDRDRTDTADCVNADDDPLATDALQQQFRQVEMPAAAAAGFDVAESLAWPGMCVVVDTDGEPDACACADLALAVRAPGRSAVPFGS